jgi:regulator of protease activity HflC (stomatin/prohibitin superfamily)
MSTTAQLPTPGRDVVGDEELGAIGGGSMCVVTLAVVAISVWFVHNGFNDLLQNSIALLGIAIIGILLKGFVILQPNESLVCLLFGSYVGTEHRSGLWWVNPLNSQRKILRRLETLESGPLKVNDAVGNPIDIGAVVVWRVEDAARALLEVGSYTDYVKAQSETALRRMASDHPYDQVEVAEVMEVSGSVSGAQQTEGGLNRPISTITLRDGGDAIAEALLLEIRTRMEPIGIAVIEARISHLAYSSEIAGAMLRKQAASAVVAARRMVVKGAVSIVEDALNQLDEKKIAGALDPERKAAMISNLLVVLVGDREVAPVINTGTLYQ